MCCLEELNWGSLSSLLGGDRSHSNFQYQICAVEALSDVKSQAEQRCLLIK